MSTTYIDISIGEHDLHWDNVTVTPEPGGNPSVYLRAYLERNDYIYALQATAVSTPPYPLTLSVGGQHFPLEGSPDLTDDGHYLFADCRVHVTGATLTTITQALARHKLSAS
ncbi:MAG: hypothetical protein F4Z00_12805 [Acidimicrobiaceae bacterium]|nr:hypothetical protein [Acidimicrobiaceae bacterium]MXZ66404.1 hypothetical protein [Acidimicrobiaceae bacterium]MYF34350.1 hypothetical protein [Acidimicrobiaceae bacterium]MYG78915.1 hypothetical protein [Acidimicrobiaceae bacterium]MYJ83525.1 hypothetical protein [Acidimicrobiaceae bacterium]